MRLYLKYVSILFRSQMQYRASFWMLCLGQFLVPFTVFMGFFFMFSRFGEVRGWTFYEAALCFGVVHMAFSLAECFVRGFDAFSTLVVSGGFDRLLTRPRNTVLQVLGSRFEFTRVGRLLNSVVVLGIAVANVPVEWTLVKAATLLFMVLGGVFVFAGIFILGATLCFWTIQGLEVANVLTDGGREMAQYPLDIYAKWVTVFFTFIIPFGLVSYMPLLFVIGKLEVAHELLYMAMPLTGVLFLLPCLLVWRVGVRHYRSTGS